jgi:hypothetical protein
MSEHRRKQNPSERMDIHREGVAKAKIFIDRCARDRRPLPSGRNKKTQYSPVHLAAQLDISVKTASSKAVRGLVASHGQKLKAGAWHRPPLGRAPQLSELMAYSIARRETENVAKKIPKDTGVDALRDMFFEAARHRSENMHRDASAQLSDFAAKRKLNKAIREEIGYAQDCLRRVLSENGAPDDFAGRLAYVVKFAGWTYVDLDLAIGARAGLTNSWALGYYCPTEEQDKLVVACARVLGVPKEFLLDKVVRGRTKYNRAFPADLRTPENADIRREIRKHFPRNFRRRTLKAQQRIVEKLRPECEAKVLEERKRKPRRGPSYGFHHKDWPAKLRRQWEQCRKHHMEGHSGWTRLESTWNDKSAEMRLVQGGLAFGVELLRNGGRKELLNFAMFEDPAFVERYIDFRIARTTAPGEKPVNSIFDAQDMDQWARIWAPSNGWIVQSAMMRRELGWSGRSDEKWRAHCAEVYAAYRSRAKSLRKRATRKLDRHRRVPVLTRVKEPKAVAKLAIGELERKWRALPKGTPEADAALQDLVLCGIRVQAPFRDETMVQIEWHPGFRTGHVKRDRLGWNIDAPKKIFKNRDGAAVRYGVFRRLRDQWGLRGHLEEFWKARLRMLDGIDSPYLFVYGLKHLPAMVREPKRTDRVKHALYRRIKRVTQRAFEDLGLPEVRWLTATDFRDMVSLSVKKLSRDPDLTADSVNDGMKVADTVYADEQPWERVDWLFDVQAAGADAAAAAARELLANNRRVPQSRSVQRMSRALSRRR